MAHTLPKTVDFDGTTLFITDHDGHAWLTVSQISAALGTGRAHVHNLYTRYQDEFSGDMTKVIIFAAAGQVAPAEHRIFSTRGVHLLAMLSRAPRAKAFRRWVLDVLERLDAGAMPARALPGPAALPQPSAEAAILRDDLRRAKAALGSGQLAATTARDDLARAGKLLASLRHVTAPHLPGRPRAEGKASTGDALLAENLIDMTERLIADAAHSLIGVTVSASLILGNPSTGAHGRDGGV